MRNLIFIFPFLLLMSISSCVKMPHNSYVPALDVPTDFDWKSIEAKKVTLTQVSSVLNESGDTVASFLPPGDYNLTVGKNSILTVVKENIAVQTKALSENIKEKVYFPAKDKYATVMFEDLFPIKGDMDMNDIVFGLNIEFYLDNQARLVGLKINIQPRAIGSSFVEIGLAANFSSQNILDIVDNISHSGEPALSPLFKVTKIGSGYSPELNNRYSQVLPLTGNFRSYFDNTKDLFINVRDIDAVTTTHNFSVEIELKSAEKFPFSNLTFLEPIQMGKINLDIFAVFGSRGKEIHVKGQRPTDLFYYEYFISTRPKTDFSTIDNWVWVIISDKSIQHPLEFKKIYNAYPNFKVWAEGSGAIGSNWYTPSVKDSLYSKANFSYVN